MKVDLRPVAPGQDAPVSTYNKEQWEVTAQQWANSIDTSMPTSINAIASLFLSDAQTVGLQAAQTLNRLVRNVSYAAALSGNTVTTAAARRDGTNEETGSMRRQCRPSRRATSLKRATDIIINSSAMPPRCRRASQRSETGRPVKPSKA